MIFTFPGQYENMIALGWNPETLASMGIKPTTETAPTPFYAETLKAASDQLVAQEAAAKKEAEAKTAAENASQARTTNIVNQLKTQYNNLVKLAPEAAYQGNASDLEAIFNQQASQLASAGVDNILDLRNVDGYLVDSRTGQRVTTTNLGGQITTDRDTGAVKWGDIFSGVEGGANYGISFDSEGKPIFYPVYEKSKSLAAQVFGSDLFKLISIGLTIYGIYNLATALSSATGATTSAAAASTAASAAGSAAAKAVATEAAKAVTQEVVKDVLTGAALGAAVFGAAGGDPVKGAILGGLGSFGSTTYASTVGATIAPAASAAAQTTIGSAVINAGLSGVKAALTGADVGKSMLAGAAKGATLPNAKTVAEAVATPETIASIVKATNLSTAQVEQIISTSVSNGVIAEVSGQGKFNDVLLQSLVDNGVGTSTANSIVNSIDLDKAVEQGIFTTTKSIATAATNAAINDQDIGTAVENAAPGAILSGYQAYQDVADQEKQIAALQQPLQVAGMGNWLTGELTPAQTALQVAANRNEEVVQTPTIDEEGTKKYVLTGVRDDGSRYYYNMFEYSDGEVSFEYNQTDISSNPLSQRQELKFGDGLSTMVITASSTQPDFRDDPTKGLPSSEYIEEIAPILPETFDPLVIPESVKTATTQNIIEQELARLEAELKALNEPISAYERAQTQYERLSDLPTRTIDEELQGQLEDELASLERQAAEGRAKISDVEGERGLAETIGAEGGRTLTDEEMLNYLETGDLPADLYGTTKGKAEGSPEGVPEGTPEGSLEGAPEGSPEGVEGGTGEGGEGEGEGGLTTTTTPLSPVLIFNQGLPARSQTEPYATRVTGDTLASILGEKEPLFTGEDEDQRAVWNRRSLRLRRALGI